MVWRPKADCGSMEPHPQGWNNLPVYAIVLEEGTDYRVLDVQSAESFATRMQNGQANGLDWLVGSFLLALLGALFFIIIGTLAASKEARVSSTYVFTK